MNHVQKMIKFIEEQELKQFTHRDIIKITNTNCPHGVLRQLKNYYEMEIEEEKVNGVRFRKYTVVKRKEKCQKI